MKTEKPWGNTESLVQTQTAELHRLSINQDGTSSYHYHEHKYNYIYVEQGKLLIQHEDTTTIILTPGKSVLLAPGEKHMFKAIGQCIAFEFYWVKIDGQDIIEIS